jgi:hypothetical protein
MRKTLLLGSAVLAVIGPAATRVQAFQDTGTYLSAGLGAGGDGLAAIAALGSRRGDRLITVRVATTQEFNLFGPLPPQSRTDAAVLFGAIQTADHGFLTASAGLGVVHSVKRGELLPYRPGTLDWPTHESLSNTTVGLALSAKAVLSTPHAGIGLECFGNVNRKASFVGLALTLDIGTLR